MHVPEAEIKVSVSIITYNHESYIAKAIESVLNQKVDFKYEIIIGDDCSSDRTPEILKEYKKRYPEKIQLIMHPRRYDNIPGRINNITNLYACRGKYIAMLDGDDYWISDDKLQKQADFLESNPDFSLCFHDSLMISENDEFEPYLFSAKHKILTEKKIFSQFDFFTHGFLAQTSSVLFQNLPFGEFPEWFWRIYSADFAIQLLILQYGKAHYFPALKSGRHFNQKSVSSIYRNSSEKQYLKLQDWKGFHEHFRSNTELKSILRKGISYHYYKHSYQLLKQHKVAAILDFALSLYYHPIALKLTLKSISRRFS
jgi:glycosyltransferase involved in cell wall biosynthesis